MAAVLTPPRPTLRDFLQEYVIGQRAPMILTVKSNGASVNIDGPFFFETFRWPEWKPNVGLGDEVVIRPDSARPRDRGESSVHMHVSWENVNHVRLQYLTERELPLIPCRIRISFYKDPPPADSRGSEIFWFYTDMTHPLTDQLPEVASGFSESRALA